MREDFQKQTTSINQISLDTGQDGTNTPEDGSSIGNKEEREKIDSIDCNKESINKQDILQLIGQNVSHTSQPQTTPRKKRRKEKEKVEHSIVKQSQSSYFPLSDHTKRKTKKMAEMQDFLERERNVSLLNDLCKSKFGGFRKKLKRNTTSSDKPSSSSSYDRFTFTLSPESIELDSYDTDYNKASTYSDISHLYPNLRTCGEEPQIKQISEISGNSLPNEESSGKVCLTSNESGDDNGSYYVSMQCGASAKHYNPFLFKNEIEVGDSKTVMNEDNESSGLNLLISDVKGSAWIDPDCYTSDESALVIDESVDTHETYFDEEARQASLDNNTKKSENSLSEGVTNTGTFRQSPLDHPEFQSKSNSSNTVLKSGSTSDSVTVHSRSSEPQELSQAVNSASIQIQSPSRINNINTSRNIDNNLNSIDCYIIEVQDEVFQNNDSIQSPCCSKDVPIRKIKLKKVDKREKIHISNKQKPSLSSSKRSGNIKVCGSKYSSTKTRINEVDVIIDLDNYVETQKEDLTKKDVESSEKLKTNPGRTLGNASGQIKGSSNVNTASSSIKDPGYSSNQIFMNYQHKVNNQTECKVLRRHLESGAFNRKYSMLRDPRTSKTSFYRREPLNTKARVCDRNISVDNQTSESLFYLYDTDIPWQNPLGEFNRIIYVIYRELLTPHSQHLMGQLTEILYLVISESVRYSDRCKKARVFMPAELVIQEQVLAHRDFQANTIFYGMYFTHLFRNVVQCFPDTKEFHIFMYLALFVNLARRLKSNYNVHITYLHIARKLIVAMLKANNYDDIIVFSAIYKPDSVFETDFILVSQLIDSFAEFVEKPSPQETNYLFQSNQYNHNFQQTLTPAGYNKKILHPEFPPVRINVTPTIADPTQTTSQSQSHSFKTKRHEKEDTHVQSRHNTLIKNTNFTSSRDPRAWAHSSGQEKTNNGKSRSKMYLVTDPHMPGTQGVGAASYASSLLWPKPTSISMPGSKTLSTFDSRSMPAPASANSTAVHISTSSSILRTGLTSATSSNLTSNPTTFRESSSSEKAQANNSLVTPQSGFDESQSTDVHVWRPTAIRPRFRPCLPYYPSAPFLLNALIGPPTYGDHCL